MRDRSLVVWPKRLDAILSIALLVGFTIALGFLINLPRLVHQRR